MVTSLDHNLPSLFEQLNSCLSHNVVVLQLLKLFVMEDQIGLTRLGKTSLLQWHYGSQHTINT